MKNENNKDTCIAFESNSNITVDISSMTASLTFIGVDTSRVSVKVKDATCVYIRRNVAFVARCGHDALVFRDDAMTSVEVKARYKVCENDVVICGRWTQERGDDIFLVSKDDMLYRISWDDIL